MQDPGQATGFLKQCSGGLDTLFCTLTRLRICATKKGKAYAFENCAASCLLSALTIGTVMKG